MRFFFTFFYILYEKKVLQSWKFLFSDEIRLVYPEHDFSIFMKYLFVLLSVCDKYFLAVTVEKLMDEIPWHFIFSVILTWTGAD